MTSNGNKGNKGTHPFSFAFAFPENARPVGGVVVQPGQVLFPISATEEDILAPVDPHGDTIRDVLYSYSGCSRHTGIPKQTVKRIRDASPLFSSLNKYHPDIVTVKTPFSSVVGSD